MKVILCPIILLVLCLYHGNAVSDEVSLEQNAPQEARDSIFKLWLNDTLRLLHKQLRKERRAITGFVGYAVDVSDDSVSLQIRRCYRLTVHGKRSLIRADAPTMAIIDMLDRYGELPRSGFRLNLTCVLSYVPFMGKASPYDVQEEFPMIQVRRGNATIEYEYMRGSLRGSRELRVLHGRRVVKSYEFRWNGRRMTKVEAD